MVESSVGVDSTVTPLVTPVPVHVTVCICTYQRPLGLKELLDGLERQVFQTIPGLQLAVVVADNEGSDQVAQVCKDFQSRLAIPLTYVHVVQRGISHARNACFAQAPSQTDFFAIIDDDEIPEINWLEQLLLAQARTDADAVTGPVIPVFVDGVPIWIAESGFFKTPRDMDNLVDGQQLNSAATGNVLLRATLIKEHAVPWFNTRFGLSGGEDTLFFRYLHQAGYRIVWATNARVYETIPRQRACFRYLWREEYRRGNVVYDIKLLRSQRLKQGDQLFKRCQLVGKMLSNSLMNLLLGAKTVIRSFLAGRLRKAELASGALQIARGLGVLTSIFGLRYQHYR